MSDEKTEQPTDKKLEDAHKDGETAKSADLTAAVVLLSGCLLLSMTATFFGDRWRALLDLALDVDGSRHPVMTLKQTLGHVALQLVLMTLPVGFVFALIAWIATWAQTGVVLSFKPVELKMNAVNPASGLKRIFSMRSMIDLLKMLIKAAAVVAAVWKLIMILMPAIVGAAYQSVMDIAEIGMTLLVRLLAAGGGLFLILGAADFGIQRWLFIRDHRMSKDEVKREHKNSEGDPHIKGERKKLARELAEEAKPKQSVAGAQGRGRQPDPLRRGHPLRAGGIRPAPHHRQGRGRRGAGAARGSHRARHPHRRQPAAGARAVPRRPLRRRAGSPLRDRRRSAGVGRRDGRLRRRAPTLILTGP